LVVDANGTPVPNWTAILRARLLELSPEPPDPELVEELAVHLGEIYEDALTQGMTDEEAERHTRRLLEPSLPFVQALEARTARLRGSGAGHGAPASERAGVGPLRVRERSASIRALAHAHGTPVWGGAPLSDARRPSTGRRLRDWAAREPPGPGKGRRIVASIDITRDSRYALRMFVRAPLFSLIAILTFAIGIGVNAAVFSVVNGVLLEALPYPDADRITMVWLDNQRQGIKEDITSYPNYADWRDQNSSYVHLAAVTGASFNLTGAGEPERLRGALATASLFDVMGVQPFLGRLYTTANEVEGQDGVVVLSYGLWQRRFGGAADAIGRTLLLNGRPHEIVGVMRPELRWPEDAELWKPLAPDQDDRTARFSFWLPVMGRLKPGVSVDQAQADMSAISDRLTQSYPNMRGFGANVVPFKTQLVGGVERGLLVLMAAVGFVLLIACVNLANLMLGRTAARRRELAIRTALGAGRGRIVRHIMTEALVLAAIGGALGVTFAYWATDFFVALAGNSIPRAEGISLDARVLLFAGGLTALSALLAAIVPAFQASSTAAADHLREGGRQGDGGGGRRTRNLLVAVEVALAIVLLTGAGLLIRTLWNMQQLDRGFEAGGVAMATLSPPASTYPSPVEVRGFYGRVLERVRALPGVESAALTTGVLQPLLANSSVFSIEGRPDPPPEERIEYPFEGVSPGFFETLRIAIVRGRAFTDQDHAEAPRAVILNETLARQGWPGQDSIGRRIRFGGGDDSPWMTVVGVIRDVHRVAPQRAIRPELYLCSLQVTPRTQSLVIRTAGDPAAIIPAVRREVQALDPQLPLFRVGTLAGELSNTLRQPRFQATLLVVFALVALLLATVGIYGVTSHAVSQRTQEVGIRMALGAHGRDVLRLILRQHLQPAVLGIVIGVAAAVALSRYLQSLLYGVRATDPATFAAVAVGLLLVAAAACWIPARRAVRADPLVALRNE
jgi:putative ABC transport system permease protein